MNSSEDYRVTIRLSNGVKVVAFVSVAAALLWYGIDLSSRPVPQTVGEQSAAGRLQVQDVKVGEGAEAKPGDALTVHYSGTLADGTEFENSRTIGRPLTFTLGIGQVIPGWDGGLAGMKVGGVRRLGIPPALGYGDRAVGVIPPRSPLFFTVELLEINAATDTRPTN